MLAARILVKPVFVRELLPQDIKLGVRHLERTRSSVVDLIAAHETAYLEHCRQWARQQPL